MDPGAHNFCKQYFPRLDEDHPFLCTVIASSSLSTSKYSGRWLQPPSFWTLEELDIFNQLFPSHI